MSRTARTVVTFRSSLFNTLYPEEYSEDQTPLGEDVAAWLIRRLRDKAVQTDDTPGPEDFGWFFYFRHLNESYCLVVTCRPEDDTGLWICALERNRGLIASLFGGRTRGIGQDVPVLLHSVLSEASEIKEIAWYSHKDFLAGLKGPGAPTP